MSTVTLPRINTTSQILVVFSALARHSLLFILRRLPSMSSATSPVHPVRAARLRCRRIVTYMNRIIVHK